MSTWKHLIFNTKHMKHTKHTKKIYRIHQFTFVSFALSVHFVLKAFIVDGTK